MTGGAASRSERAVSGAAATANRAGASGCGAGEVVGVWEMTGVSVAGTIGAVAGTTGALAGRSEAGVSATTGFAGSGGAVTSTGRVSAGCGGSGTGGAVVARGGVAVGAGSAVVGAGSRPSGST